MPRRNIYIRPENLEAWEASGKSSWINALLTTDSPAEPEILNVPSPPNVQTVDNLDLDKLRAAQASKAVEFCKHQQVKGFCKKGCKWMK